MDIQSIAFAPRLLSPSNYTDFAELNAALATLAKDKPYSLKTCQPPPVRPPFGSRTDDQFDLWMEGNAGHPYARSKVMRDQRILGIARDLREGGAAPFSHEDDPVDAACRAASTVSSWARAAPRAFTAEHIAAVVEHLYHWDCRVAYEMVVTLYLLDARTAAQQLATLLSLYETQYSTSLTADLIKSVLGEWTGGNTSGTLYRRADPQPVSFSVLEKAERYHSKVAERLRRATRALDAAGISYAVIGGNAVMAWIVQVDETAVRHTQDVDILLDPAQFDRAREALEKVGFVYRHAASIDVFLDGPEAKARDALHVVFAGRKVRPEHPLASPELGDAVRAPQGFLVLDLPALVRMKLTSFRLKDQVHLQDLASVGLIDFDWLNRVPAPLVERLRFILEHPEA